MGGDRAGSASWVPSDLHTTGSGPWRSSLEARIAQGPRDPIAKSGDGRGSRRGSPSRLGHTDRLMRLEIGQGVKYDKCPSVVPMQGATALDFWSMKFKPVAGAILWGYATRHVAEILVV